MNPSLSADYGKKQKINTGTRTKGLSLFISDQIFVFEEVLSEFIITIIIICTVIIIIIIIIIIIVIIIIIIIIIVIL